MAILAVGGWLLVNRAYYVGVNGDEVAVYRGLNQEIFGLRLSTVVATSDVAIEDLPARLVRQLEDGVPQGSLIAAMRYIDSTLRTTVTETETEVPVAAPAQATAAARADAAEPAATETDKNEPPLAAPTEPAPTPS